MQDAEISIDPGEAITVHTKFGSVYIWSQATLTTIATKRTTRRDDLQIELFGDEPCKIRDLTEQAIFKKGA
jgi:hypothetical protein